MQFRCNVQDLLKDNFFAESTFTVDVIESDQGTVKLELKGSQKIIPFSYFFNYHTPASVVKELVCDHSVMIDMVCAVTHTRFCQGLCTFTVGIPVITLL